MISYQYGLIIPRESFSGASQKLVNFIVPTSPLGRLPQNPTAVVVRKFF